MIARVATAAFALAPSRGLALVLLPPLCFATGLPFSIAPPALQVLAPGAMRGQVFAAFLLVASLVGFGFGPVLSALLGDRLFGGPLALALAHGFALAAGLCGVASAIFLVRGLNRFPVAGNA